MFAKIDSLSRKLRQGRGFRRKHGDALPASLHFFTMSDSFLTAGHWLSVCGLAVSGEGHPLLVTTADQTEVAAQLVASAGRLHVCARPVFFVIEAGPPPTRSRFFLCASPGRALSASRSRVPAEHVTCVAPCESLRRPPRPPAVFLGEDSPSLFRKVKRGMNPLRNQKDSNEK